MTSVTASAAFLYWISSASIPPLRDGATSRHCGRWTVERSSPRAERCPFPRRSDRLGRLRPRVIKTGYRHHWLTECSAVPRREPPDREHPRVEARTPTLSFAAEKIGLEITEFLRSWRTEVFATPTLWFGKCENP